MAHKTKDKGDLAVVKVIADLVEKDWNVSLPMSEHLKYDLIAEKDGRMLRVQVKFRAENKKNSGTISIPNGTVWADKNGNHTRRYQSDDFDFFAIFIPELNICIYPPITFGGSQIRFENPKIATTFFWFEDFLNFTTEAKKRQLPKKDPNRKSKEVQFGPKKKRQGNRTSGEERKTPAFLESSFQKRKVERPSKEELEKLLWEEPMTHLAKKFGVSDKAIKKWARSFGLETPNRGFWEKKENEKKKLKFRN